MDANRSTKRSIGSEHRVGRARVGIHRLVYIFQFEESNGDYRFSQRNLGVRFGGRRVGVRLAVDLPARVGEERPKGDDYRSGAAGWAHLIRLKIDRIEKILIEYL